MYKKTETSDITCAFSMPRAYYYEFFIADYQLSLNTFIAYFFTLLKAFFLEYLMIISETLFQELDGEIFKKIMRNSR